MKVLSLFDGMACGMLAFKSVGVEIESYDAYEIDKYAIKTATHNFPNIKEHGDVFTADFTQYKGVDFVVGGSPCTYWSIAQKNNRETEASGMGWELFSQYLRAIKEAEPKYFIYENNKSMSAAIRQSIDNAFGFGAVYINSALVSAQNRQRLYWVGKRNADGSYSKVDVKQPKDRGILLRDILEREAYRIPEYGNKDKARPLNALYPNNCGGFEHRIWNANPKKQQVDLLAEPVRVGALPRPNGELSTSQAMRIYSVDGKAVTQSACGGGMGGKTGLYAVPYEFIDYEPRKNSEIVVNDNSIRCVLNDAKKSSAQETVVKFPESKANAFVAAHIPKVIDNADHYNVDKVYRVEKGFIGINCKQYPIKLADGYYIIRKLTVTECKRLQTVPEWYEFPVSKAQAYKMLGNGWTVEVIAHLINSALTNKTIVEEMEQKSIFDVV